MLSGSIGNDMILAGPGNDTMIGGAAEIRFDPAGSGHVIEADLNGDGVADMIVVLSAGDFVL